MGTPAPKIEDVIKDTVIPSNLSLAEVLQSISSTQYSVSDATVISKQKAAYGEFVAANVEEIGMALELYATIKQAYGSGATKEEIFGIAQNDNCCGGNCHCDGQEDTSGLVV